MKIFKEFKEFAVRGNLVDMAVAFVMGAAFGKVVSSFISGVIMPVVGKIAFGIDFKALKLVLSSAVLDARGAVVSPEVSISYGDFVSVVIDFFILSFVMFVLVKTTNKLKKNNEAPPPAAPEPTAEEKLLVEIRDLLKKK